MDLDHIHVTHWKEVKRGFVTIFDICHTTHLRKSSVNSFDILIKTIDFKILTVHEIHLHIVNITILKKVLVS